ncbi:fructosamine kinase [Pontibacillus halophilus JSM 076056 = DSM 19796]|uniref:Fructosamine kinase n=1 Tax=Pontibacillus halophilus JSM 076056 = DSM 19796 TaxID=1385510 RepID=A0A0A5GPB1_9BACI|nr:fructosamine kinase family protein [Pontibacillus halophilus]KGX93829.1 fructosamine kinase [Pontibacillus halophilus JSM 076056 = DSM 19796]
MERVIQHALLQLGDSSNLRSIRSVEGGDINQAAYVETEENAYFVKTNQNVPRHFFRVEAKGLKEIEASQSIAVPKVYYYDEPVRGSKGALVMEWIEGASTKDTKRRLGEQVALLHSSYGDKFGYEEDSFMGLLPQPNDWYEDWIDYYHDGRLVPQFNMAKERHYLPEDRKQRLLKLMERLPNWIDSSVQPSLLHGDLWGGNWMAGPEGKPYLIDPSVLYGDRCFELAFTELFGGFSKEFYEGYKEILPIPDHYSESKAVYQLFYLLAHLNLFGEMYGTHVDRILKRYVD